MNNLKQFILCDNSQKYKKADEILNNIIDLIKQKCNINIEEATIFLLNEKKKYNKFEILSSKKINNIHKCKIVEPYIIDKLSIVYISKQSYIEKDIYIDFIKIENFYIFIFFKLKDLNKYLNKIQEILKGTINE